MTDFPDGLAATINSDCDPIDRKVCWKRRKQGIMRLTLRIDGIRNGFHQFF